MKPFGAKHPSLSRPVNAAHKANRKSEKYLDQGSFRSHSVKPLQYKTTLNIIPCSYFVQRETQKSKRAYKVDARTSLNPDIQLEKLMNTIPGKDFQDTVPHKLMKPTGKGAIRGLKGTWHVKKPGKVSKMERAKRYLISLFMIVRNKAYKALHYRDITTLAQKEVLAGKLTQLAEIKGPTFAIHDWKLARDMRFGYVNDNGDDSVASQHIDNDYMATNEVSTGVTYDGEHNPATAFVFRRYLLGDEDGVKKDNYLVKVDSLFGFHCFIPIDYGLAFYNHSESASSMNFKEFVNWSLTLPRSHKIHYGVIKRGDSIMGMIDSMSTADKTRSVYMALTKIAAIEEKELQQLCQQISDPYERANLQKQLTTRVAVAKRLVEEARQLREIKIML